MKIRQGFVSNSSSTSFLLACLSQDRCSNKLLKKIPLWKLVEYGENSNCVEETEMKFHGEFLDLLEKVQDLGLYKSSIKKLREFGFEEKNMYEEWEYYYFSVNNHDEILRTQISIFEEEGDLFIIDFQEG